MITKTLLTIAAIISLLMAGAEAETIKWQVIISTAGSVGFAVSMWALAEVLRMEKL